MKIQNEVYFGCMPALMTPCTAKGEPQFDTMVRTGKELMDAGMSAVVYCGSMGEWPLLTDEQRMEGVRLLTEAGVPVVVGTGAQSPRQAVAHAEHAAKVGAAGLMLIPRVLSRGPCKDAQLQHFAALLQAAPHLPAVIYNSPVYGYQTKADVFFALCEKHPNLVGFKEFGGAEALTYAAEYITSDKPELPLVVGLDTQVYHGYIHCGASGAITGVGNALPHEVLHLIDLCKRAAAGDAQARVRAAELRDALAVLTRFDVGPDLVLYYKHLMVLEGHPEYAYPIEPTDTLTSSQRAFLEAQWRLFRTWWEAWKDR